MPIGAASNLLCESEQFSRLPRPLFARIPVMGEELVLLCRAGKAWDPVSGEWMRLQKVESSLFSFLVPFLHTVR